MYNYEGDIEAMLKRSGIVAGIAGAAAGWFGVPLGFKLIDIMAINNTQLKLITFAIAAGLIAYITCMLLDRLWK